RSQSAATSVLPQLSCRPNSLIDHRMISANFSQQLLPAPPVTNTIDLDRQSSVELKRTHGSVLWITPSWPSSRLITNGPPRFSASRHLPDAQRTSRDHRSGARLRPNRGA